MIDVESRLGPADRARRAFDVRLSETVLKYVTEGGQTPKSQDLAAAARKSFAWVAGELEPIARASGIASKEAALDVSKITNDESAIAEQMFCAFFHLWFRQVYKLGRSEPPTIVPRRPDSPLAFAKGVAWLNEQLTKLYVIESFRIDSAGMRRQVLPCLNTVSRCVAYAMALMIENRWGIADRVRVCRLIQKPGHGFHIFLDYKLDESGMLKVGRAREFCGPHHANTYRQRKMRSDLARRKHK